MTLIANTGISSTALQDAFSMWDGLADAQFKLINHTENATFLVTMPDGEPKILRVHRPGYNSYQAINSELVWSLALRRDAGVPTPVAVEGRDGAYVQCAHISSDAQETRFLVLFEFESGRMPETDDNPGKHFVALGRIAALCHQHAQNWKLPTVFERPTWSAERILDPDAIWGDWRKAPGMDGTFRPVYEQLDHRLRIRLGNYGRERNRFGLIHADMRLANLLVDGQTIKLIDFDDCGYGWYMYDFAAAVSFMEDSPRILEFKQQWLRGYRTVRAVSNEEEQEMDTFVMLRRMALTAWIGSHAETPFAAALATDFVPVGARLARHYLSGRALDWA